MPFDDFRGFLAYLEERGELVRVGRPVDRYLETSLVTKKSLEVDGPALLFENVKGSNMPIAVGIYGSRERICLGLDTTPKDFIRTYLERSKSMGQFPPKIVRDGPCKENILLGDQVDLNLFPAPWHAPHDKGYYIVATVCIAKDPDTGVRNASVHRLYLHERNQTGLWMSPIHLSHIIMKHWERGIDCPMAVAIGCDPAVMMAASENIPYEDDEFDYAGALRQRSVEMVPCETVPLEVPATAEIVLEGVVPVNVRKPEAPFVEFTGYYGDERNSPVFNVQAITHRNSPIFHDVITGPPPDENQPLHMGNEVEIYRLITRVFPPECVLDVYLTPGGCIIFDAVIRIKKRFPGQGRQVLTAALAYRPLKNVIVVDDDIDARDPVQVEWAVSTRCRGQEDMVFINGSIGTPLDPTTTGTIVNKVGFDATRPIGNDKVMSKMVDMPCYYPTHTVDLEDYIGSWQRPALKPAAARG